MALDLKKLSNEAEVALVDLRPEIWANALFCTISPNPNATHACKKMIGGRLRDCKIKYGMMPQRVQYQYCMKVIKNVYNYSKDTKIYGCAELNKQGDVHMHFLMSDLHIKNKVDLKVFQRDVLNSQSVLHNLSKCGTDWMNSIVFVNDSIDAREAYFKKERSETIEKFPSYCTRNVLKEPGEYITEKTDDEIMDMITSLHDLIYKSDYND